MRVEATGVAAPRSDRTMWVAVLLGLLAPPLGMLFLGRAWRALIYFLVQLALYVVGHAADASAWWPAAAWTFPPLVAFHGLVAFDAWRIVRAHGRRMTWYARWPSLVVIATLVWFGALGFTRHVLQPFNIAAASMAPTLIQGDQVLVRPLSDDDKLRLTRGDVVVFRLAGVGDETYVKRVVGVPGDVIRYEGQQIWINGVALGRTTVKSAAVVGFQPRWLAVPHYLEHVDDRQYEIMIAQPDEGPKGEVTVPPEHYFMFGDNRSYSNDSRFLGSVPAQAILGKPALIWWSAVTEGIAETRWDRIGRWCQPDTIL